ncbi:MAG: tetratricopeptide repeat protein, partial [Terriglobia bacterium]
FYSRKIQSDPNDSLAHLRLGYSYRAGRQFQKALKEFDQTVTLDPKSALAHYEFADLLSLTQDYEKAIAEFREAIRLKPDFVEPYFGLDAIYVTLRNYEEAIRICKEAARIRPELDVLKVAYGRIAMINKFMGRKEERIGALRLLAGVEKELLEIDPDALVGPQTSLNQAADLSQETGRNEDARELYKESIALDHDYEETYHSFLQLANLAKKLGRIDESERCYDQIAAMTGKLLKETKDSSGKGEGYYRLGIISERRGREKEALELYLKSTKMRPSHARTHRALARLYSKAGKQKLADTENGIAKKLEEAAERELDFVRSLGKQK